MSPGSITHGALPITLGGDHSLALGSASGAANALGDIGIIWFDAHADFNTAETSPSGNIHGMILGALAGYGDQRLVSVAKASQQAAPRGPGPDRDRRRTRPGSGRGQAACARPVFMSFPCRRSTGGVSMRSPVRRWRWSHTAPKGIHVSFDMDVVDPSEAPGVGTPVPGGITYREAHMAMELVAENGKMVSLDFVEVNPILDQVNRTAILATELALSAMGKRTF